MEGAMKIRNFRIEKAVEILLLLMVSLSYGSQANQQQASTIQEAAEKGDFAAVEAFLKKGVDVNYKTSNGETPLMLASQNGHKDVAEVLIAKGADLNAKTNEGTTPLMLASQNGHNDVAELLIAKGADVLWPDSLSAQFRLYLGPERPLDQVAILSITPTGKKISVNGSDGFEGWVIALLPGAHVVSVVYPGMRISWERREIISTLHFNAEAGHEYKLANVTVQGDTVEAIVDMTTMQVVHKPAPQIVQYGTGYTVWVDDDKRGGRYSTDLPGINYPPFGLERKGPKIGICYYGVAYFGPHHPLKDDIDLTKLYRLMNLLGFKFDPNSEPRPSPNQHVRLSRDKSQFSIGDRFPVDMFVAECTPIIRWKDRLFVENPSAGDVLLDLMAMHPNQIDSISGLAQKIARVFSFDVSLPKRAKVSSKFYFTHAYGGDFFVVITWEGQTSEIVLSEKD
jgi:hypothetical protein